MFRSNAPPRRDTEPIFKKRTYQQAYSRIGQILDTSERAGEVPSSTLFVPFLHLNTKKIIKSNHASALLKVYTYINDMSRERWGDDKLTQSFGHIEKYACLNL
jgi:hypothetical protein